MFIKYAAKKNNDIIHAILLLLYRLYVIITADVRNNNNINSSGTKKSFILSIRFVSPIMLIKNITTIIEYIGLVLIEIK